MFKLHDKTRRLLTLLIFLLLGPTLLLVVLTKVGSRHSVRTVGEWEVLLTNALGKRVEIEGVQFPAPGVVRFSQMQVVDPETNAIVMQIPQWELFECLGEMPHYLDPALVTQKIAGQAVENIGGKTVQTGTASGEFYEPYLPRSSYKRGLFASIGFSLANLSGSKPRYWHCEIPEIACYDTAVPQAKDALLELMTKLPAAQAGGKPSNVGVKPAVLFVGMIDVFYRDEKPDTATGADIETAAAFRQGQKPKRDYVTLKNACFEFRPEAERADLLATFQLVDQPSDAEAFRLAVTRERRSATTRVQFASGGNEIPARLPASLDPFFAGFGPESRFAGTIVSENGVDTQKKRSRTLELSETTFSKITLDSLLSRSLTFRLDGTADRLTLEEARFRGESNDPGALRIEYARGTMINARGIASWPGLHRLISGTRLQLSPRDANPPETDITFRDGTFAFLFDPQGIQLYPQLVQQSQTKPLLTIDNHCDVLWPDPKHVIGYDELLAALSQPDSRQIPLMSETQHLLSTLPITVTPGVPATRAESESLQPSPPQTAQRVRLRDAITESSETPSSAMSEPFPPTMPAHSPSQLTRQDLMQLQPPGQPVAEPTTAYRENASPMGAVPQLADLMQRESYQQQPPLPSAPMTPQPQYGSYAMREPVPESQFLRPQQPMPQQTAQSYAQQPNVPQTFVPQQSGIPATAQPANMPYGVTPYDGGVPLVAQQQQQRRVVISGISGISNQVQTSATAGDSFDNDTPSFVNPFETQVATAPQSQRYDGAMTSPGQAGQGTPSAQVGPPGQSNQFQLWRTDATGNNR